MSIIKHITLQKIVAHDFRNDLRITHLTESRLSVYYKDESMQHCTQIIDDNSEGFLVLKRVTISDKIYDVKSR